MAVVPQALPQTWYRNIKCSDDVGSLNPERRLAVFDKPELARQSQFSFAFGSLVPVQAEHTDLTGCLWFQLGQGATVQRVNVAGHWVLAEYPDGGKRVKQCAKLTGREDWGRPQPEEYAGQVFGRMFTEGYDGQRAIVLLSASGQAFWQAVNITCLLRNMATATVFEQGWADAGDAFEQWVAHYGENVYHYGLASGHKLLCVTVKPTANWQRYAQPQGWSAALEEVAGDLGRAQQAECKYLRGRCQALGFQWSDVRFYTVQSFLKEHGRWTLQDCADEALKQLRSVAASFGSQTLEAMENDFFAQIFCLEEAFECGDLQELLQVPQEERRRPASLPTVPPAGRPRLGAADLQPLQSMCRLWGAGKEELKRVMQRLNLPDFEDADLLDSMEALHGACSLGSEEAVRAILAALRKSSHGSACLLKPSRESRSTPLHVAAKSNQPCAEAVAGLLLVEAVKRKQLGAVLRARDDEGRTPLVVATKKLRKVLLQPTLEEVLLQARKSLAGAKEAHQVGVTWEEMGEAFRSAGYDTCELRRVGFTAQFLYKAGYAALDLHSAGFHLRDLRCAGFTADALRTAGFAAEHLRKAGFADADLLWAGFELSGLRKAGFEAADLNSAGYELRDLREAGFTADDLRKASFGAVDLHSAGFQLHDLRTAGFTADNLCKAGFGAADLLAAGFEFGDLLKAGFTAERVLRSMGIKLCDLRESGCTAKQLYKAGITDPDKLLSAGYKLSDLHEAGFTLERLRRAGFTAVALHTAGFKLCELCGGEITLENLRKAGFEAEDLNANGYETSSRRQAAHGSPGTAHRELTDMPDRDGLCVHSHRAAGGYASAFSERWLAAGQGFENAGDCQILCVRSPRASRGSATASFPVEMQIALMRAMGTSSSSGSAHVIIERRSIRSRGGHAIFEQTEMRFRRSG